MEWLSHSQKKHCELCKTPFRFTKLYAPNMPRALPFHIFLRHLVKYLFSNLLVWLRAVLVISVWLGWLPYLMRSVWSFLFWISDEGLGGGAQLNQTQSRTLTSNTLSDSLSALTTTGVCPSSPLFAATTTAATIGGVMDHISVVSIPQLVKTLSAVNFTHGNRPYAAFMRLVFGSGVTAENGGSQNLSSLVSETDVHPSLLSQISFLRNLTRSPPVNRVIIAILEGQLITVAVVVCFILIILVRDYVVQQQPEINMRAAFAEENEQPPQPPVRDFGDVAVEVIDNLPGPHSDEDDSEDDASGSERVHYIPEVEPERLRQLMAVRDDQNRRDMAGPSSLSDWTGPRDGPSREDVAYMVEQEPDLDVLLTGVATQGYGSRDFSESGFTDGGQNVAVGEFLRIYRAAGGDLKLVLQTIREQQLEDDYWVRLIQGRLESMTDESNRTQYASTPRSNASSQDEHLEDVGDSISTADKGKARAQDYEVDDDASLLMGNPLRPRANTDGPKLNTNINPLANNSWSFADLPSAKPSQEQSAEGLVPAEAEADQDLQQTDSDSTYPTSASSSVVAEPTAAASEIRSTRGGSDWMEVPEMEPIEAEPAAARIIGARPLPPRPQPVGDGLVNRVANFMWQDVEAIDPAELFQPAVDEADEDALPLLIHREADENADLELELDREVVDAAVAAGFDLDAIDDAEDLEGILELLGMRGQIAGLFQNAIFCAFLVSVTIFAGVFIPYNIGRITVWIMANPMRPVRMLLSVCKFLQDVLVVCLGTVTGGVWYIFGGWWRLVSKDGLPPLMDKTIGTSWNMTVDAATRITKGFMTEMPIISAGEMRNFSALSHDALLTVKSYISSTFCAMGQVVMLAFGGTYNWKTADGLALLRTLNALALSNLKALPQLLSNPSSWVIDLSLPESTGAIDPELAYWGYGDKAWAILAGYVSLSMVAALYLRRGVPFSSGPGAQEWEASIIDMLKQASGVMKVILIIGIEMLVFPFYCGLLLDVALLPLFEDATLKSRLLFTLNNPYTSCFVHWFVGTGYMFHFALFVSMCRKIMRKGVLYFIRDPDDPEFHPVRDVLERNVTTQLRKILFSAFVYGALVIVCLGGVVWGLAYSIANVLPIHYSSNEPVLEFPIDLLFYNFLMPLAVKFFKPSDGLHAMYTWWFRKCARVLRITWFLFGQRMVDEEGTLALKEDSPCNSLPWWRRAFLEVDENNVVVPKTWKDTFEGGTAKPTSNIVDGDMMEMNGRKKNLVETGQIHRDGRFVRTPASDQVKIPKGKPVFMEVTDRNTRPDGKPDQPETDIYSTNQYQLVYVPPFFRVRIFLFIFFIWIFAAVTGVGITIVPLVFGRHMFKLLIPAHIRTNDIYAFSIGIYLLGSLAYGLLHARSILIKTRVWLATAIRSVSNRAAIRRVANVALKASKLFYAYFFLLVAFPIMLVSLFELYLLIPLHTYMYGAIFSSSTVSTVDVNTGSAFTAISIADINPKHTIRVIQAWTIGLLYMKLASRVITHYYGHTRLSAAVRAVLRRGWLDPDVAILTRAFVVPGLAIWLSLVAIPLIVGRLLIAYGVAEQVVVAVAELIGSTQTTPLDLDPASLDGTNVKVIVPEDLDRQLADAVVVLIYRMSFPITQAVISVVAGAWCLVNVFQGWKIRIRDEAYLIGERLHNFGVGNGHARARGALRT